MISVYGLKNCDTCRRARRWLETDGQPYQFVDLREDGLLAHTLERWVAMVGWQALLNRRSTTWRKLPGSARDDLDETKAITLMLEHPALIRRPVFEVAGKVIVGFSSEQQEALKAALGVY